MLPTSSSGKADAELAAARASPKFQQSTWIPSTQLAAELGVCRRTLGRWLDDAGLGFPQPRIVNRRLYFERSEIDNWKTATAVKAAEAAR
jgi:predicted DNA-binding transcriptional regulator AlpA